MFITGLMEGLVISSSMHPWFSDTNPPDLSLKLERKYDTFKKEIESQWNQVFLVDDANTAKKADTTFASP